MEGHSTSEEEAQLLRFRRSVREGLAEADRGELIEDDEVRLWLEDKERNGHGAQSRTE